MICSACATEVRAGQPFCPNCGARIEDPFIGATLLERYRIDAKIAVGGFGGIYRGTQLTTGRRVAVKVMHEELGVDPSLVARFRREGVVLCSLRDAHTVTTFEIGESKDGRLFIVMELLEGQTLLDVLRSTGPIPWTRMLRIARAICSSLAEAHALGIIHRDLKPANIFLEPRGQGDFVKVIDFGIAKVAQSSGIDGSGDLTKTGQTVGTVEYMAPEQLMGGRSDARSDIYTLGVLTYELIAGRRPFAEALGMDLLTAQLTQFPAPLTDVAGVPPEVDRIVARCLAQDTGERFPDVIALSNEIDDVLASPAWKPPPGTLDLVHDTVLQVPDEAVEPAAIAGQGPSTDLPTTIINTLPAHHATPNSNRRRSIVTIVVAFALAIALGAALAYLVP